MTRHAYKTFRPDITTHAELVTVIRMAINEQTLYPMSDTDIVKIAIEKMFSNVTGKKPVRLKRKMYIQFNS